MACHTDAVALAAARGARSADLGGVDLAELLHHVVVVGIAAGTDDNGLGVELNDLAVLVNGENTGHGAGFVDNELLGRGLIANVEANLLGVGDETHHELGTQTLGALTGIEVPGGVGLAQGDDLLEANALLLEPVDGLSGLVEEGTVKLGIGHVVVIGHEATDDLLNVDLVTSLLLPVRTHGEHALGAGEGTAGKGLLLKDDDVEAVLEGLNASGKTGTACTDNDDLVLLNLGRLTDLFHDVGVVDDRGLLAIGGRVDVASAGVVARSAGAGRCASRRYHYLIGNDLAAPVCQGAWLHLLYGPIGAAAFQGRYERCRPAFSGHAVPDWHFMASHTCPR